MQTPHNADSRYRYALGTALLVLAAALAFSVGGRRGNDTGGGNADVTRAFALMLDRCAGNTDCLTRETANLVAAAGPADVVTAAIDTYRVNPGIVPACHTYMHLLGTHLTEKVAEGNAPELGETWTECGAGLVHGAFENIDLDPDDLEGIARIVTLCAGGQFAEPLLRHHSCLHAVGHGIHTAVDGDLARGEDLCILAIPDEASFSRNHPCLAGVYMVDRDERVALLEAPVDTEGWGDLLAHCTESPRPEVCATSYFETATRHGASEALAYLDWCLSAAEETTCLLLLGQGATFRQIFPVDSDGGLDAATCPRAAEERGLDATPCFEGTRQALTASGTPSGSLDAELCRLLEGSGLTCQATRRDDNENPGGRTAGDTDGQ